MEILFSSIDAVWKESDNEVRQGDCSSCYDWLNYFLCAYRLFLVFQAL
jgi:hypothetical protein